jgi:TetR/AcrR family transcriptional regulator, fatty acid metabolism regulator protein
MPRSSSATLTVELSKPERTRAKLVDFAIREFARRGFHDTKVNDIVKAAGVAQPTFYAYFESKEAAYDMLIASFRSQLRSVTKTALMRAENTANGGVDEVTRALSSFLDFFMENPDLTRIGFMQDPARDETQAQLVSWISSNVQLEQKMGFFRTDLRSIQVARFFVGMLDQMFRQSPSSRMRETMAREAAVFACEGLWAAR